MKHTNGFTLLEILIAIAVFAILATLTSSSLYYAFTTRERLTEQTDQLTQLQLALSLLERDTIQMVERSIRGNDMRLFPAFIGQKNYVEFTRGGLTNPNSLEKRSTLTRIGLICNNNQLIRRSWPSLDPTNKNRYEDKILLKNLINCQFAYLNKSLNVLSEWHEATNPLQQIEPLPKAIQLNLSIKEWGKMSILLLIPKACYAN